VSITGVRLRFAAAVLLAGLAMAGVVALLALV
jgi:hypothetical protein